MKTSDPSLSSTVESVRSQFSTAIFVVSAVLVVFVTLVSLLLAEGIKRKGCTQQGSRGTKFAYFVYTTILSLICNKVPLGMTTTTSRNTCFYFCFSLCAHSTMSAKDIAADLGGVNTQFSRFTVVRSRCLQFFKCANFTLLFAEG